MPADPQHRRALIALNLAPTLARDVICKLALVLDRWRHAGPDGASDELAAELEVGAVQLRRGIEALRAAGVEREIERTRALGGDILTLADEDYPAPLHDLELPPPAVYLRGRLPRRPAVAIVGSRCADPFALEVAEHFGRELAGCGLAVVSGMARGIDAAAHRGALATPRGRTIAVLGSGLDRPYPRAHRRLADRIAAAGALVSEFPLGTPPHRRNFPVRNRLIAALGLGALVVQATHRSGSLITARLALELGRDVYAVPGRILDERARGPNTLIRDGALLVQRPRDVLESLPVAVQERLGLAEATTGEVDGGATSHRPPPASLSAGATALLAAMPTAEPAAVERLAEAVGEPLERALGLLLELELAGCVRRCPGPAYLRRP